MRRDVTAGSTRRRRLNVLRQPQRRSGMIQFQRTLLRLAGPAEEYSHLRHHVEDVRAGRFVIMVLAREREHRMQAPP